MEQTQTISDRRLGRERAIQALTAADLNPPLDPEAYLAEFWEQAVTLGEAEGTVRLVPRVKRLADERIRGVWTHQAEIDALLTAHLQTWNLYRLGTVERAVLRMGVWELKWGGVPVPVVINEAVDLVNWFSSPKSRALINGVLDKVSKDVSAL